MKKILTIALFMVMGLAAATPILAGHRDHYRGHPAHCVRGGHRSVYHAPRVWPGYHTSVVFGFGTPYYAPAPVYVYGLAPVVASPGYYEPVWVPGHAVYRRGTRIWIAGHWSR